MQISKLGNLINRVARHYGWEEDLDRQKAESAFMALLDADTAQTITHLKVKENVLYVKMNNAAARSNLSYRLSELLNQVNAAVGQDLLQEIRLR